MLEPVHESGEKRSKLPVCGVLAVCCPILILGLRFFVESPQGRHFNEVWFGRYYTAGMVLAHGFYLTIGLGLALVGFTLGAIALIRREKFPWLAWIAVGVNALAPLAILSYLRAH